MTTNQIVKTECPQHRIRGYELNEDCKWVCRWCGLSPDLHETNVETNRRKQGLANSSAVTEDSSTDCVDPNCEICEL
jgi:hypothetical protein